MDADKTLDKHYKPKMHWKSVNRKNVLDAMQEYVRDVAVEFHLAMTDDYSERNKEYIMKQFDAYLKSKN